MTRSTRNGARHPPMHDLHLHSAFSDGTSSIEDLADRASTLGLETIAITDHFWPSLGSRRAGESLILERLRQIEEERTRHPELRILSGAEVDIESDGSLCPVVGGLQQFDVLIASMHYRCDSSAWTSVIGKMLTNFRPHILGHWDAMLTSYREEDGQRTAAMLAEARVAVELSSRYRTEYEGFLVTARDQGCIFSLGSDSHSIETVGQLKGQIALADVLDLPILDPMRGFASP